MDAECPYCKKDIEINHDDGRGYEEGVKHSQDCDYCGKTFVFETTITFSYDTQKADCLNEKGQHDYKPTTTFPSAFTQMECTVCGDLRRMTFNERRILFPTNIDYNI